MKRGFLVLAAAVWIISLVSISHAAPFDLTFELDTKYTAEGTAPVGDPPWLTATFLNLGIIDGIGKVKLAMSTSGLTGNEFVGGWYFNLDPDYPTNAGLGFAFQGNESTGPAANASLNRDKQIAGGGANFDIFFNFPQSNAEDRFSANEVVVYIITGIDLSADSFEFATEKYDLYSAAHVQVGGAWIGATAIPEPATMLLMGIGLTGLAFLGRKKFLK
jgi:hypothetical protein